MGLHIKDIYKLVDLLEQSRDEIGRIYGDRVKDKMPLYRVLNDTINEIKKEKMNESNSNEKCGLE
jgi:hypothetical protein